MMEEENMVRQTMSKNGGKETSTAGVVMGRWCDGMVMIKGAGKREVKHVTTTMMTHHERTTTTMNQ